MRLLIQRTIETGQERPSSLSEVEPDMLAQLRPLVPEGIKSGQVTRPVVHQDTAALEQVRAGIGCLHPVPNDMRQGRLDDLPGMVRLQPFGNTGHGPVPRRCGDESEQETGSPNDPGIIDDFRLWGSRRCRQMCVPLSEGGGDIEG